MSPKKTDRNNAKDTFFIKKISQSEYRSPDKKERSPERTAAQYLNLSLSTLKVTSKKQNDELVALILEENQRILDLLMPEDLHASVDQQSYLTNIFSNLGLAND